MAPTFHVFWTGTQPLASMLHPQVLAAVLLLGIACLLVLLLILSGRALWFTHRLVKRRAYHTNIVDGLKKHEELEAKRKDGDRPLKRMMYDHTEVSRVQGQIHDLTRRRLGHLVGIGCLAFLIAAGLDGVGACWANWWVEGGYLCPSNVPVTNLLTRGEMAGPFDPANQDDLCSTKLGVFVYLHRNGG